MPTVPEVDHQGCSPCCPWCRWGDDGLEYDQNEPRQTLVDWLEKAGQ
jgi:hypothetical protein